MSFTLLRARATIKKITVDKRPQDDGSKTPTAALKVETKASADILAEFHPSLRAAWFNGSGGVRFPSMKEVGWEGTRRNVDLAIRPGPDMGAAITLRDVTLRDFKLKPLEEAGQQLVFLRFGVDLDESAGAPPVGRLVEYLKEESWIDVQGGGELDLTPPSASAKIEGLEDGAPYPPAAPKPPLTTGESVAAVRRLQPSRKGVKAKLESYPDEVLQAAIDAETAAADARPMFIEMLTAELTRRNS